MAVNIVNYQAYDSGVSTSPWDVSLDCTGANYLVVIVWQPLITSPSFSVTYNSVSLTQQINRTLANPAAAQNWGMSAWTLASPTTGTNTLSLSWTGSSQQSPWYMDAYALSGADQTTPVLGTTSIHEIHSGGTSATFYNDGEAMTITQTEQRHSLGIFAGGIVAPTTPDTWHTTGGSTPVLSGGTDRRNSSNITYRGSVWLGDVQFSKGANVTGTPDNDGFQANDYEAGGILIAIQTRKLGGEQILTME